MKTKFAAFYTSIFLCRLSDELEIRFSRAHFSLSKHQFNFSFCTGGMRLIYPVSGAQLSPQMALPALVLPPGSNIWNEVHPWESRCPQLQSWTHIFSTQDVHNFFLSDKQASYSTFLIFYCLVNMWENNNYTLLCRTGNSNQHQSRICT